MSDIGIYTTLDTIEHKFGSGYWWFGAAKPNVKEGDRFWVAWGGRWQGYFTVDEMIGPTVFFSDWKGVDGEERSPFQGFTYKVPGVVVE